MNATLLDSIPMALYGALKNKNRFLTRPGTRFVELAHASMRVRVAGKGKQTLVFIPDAPNVIEHYDALIDLLAPRFKIVCVEFPGFGFSFPKKGFDFGMDKQVELLAETLNEVAPEPIIPAMSCIGAYAGLRLASDFPDRVEKLVVLQAPTWEEEQKWGRSWSGSMVMRTPVAGQAMMGFMNVFAPKAWVAPWYGMVIPDKKARAEFLKTTLDAFKRGSCCAMSSFLQVLLKSPLSGIKPVEVPSMIVWGTKDRSHKATDKKSALEYLPNAKWVEFDHAGHFPDIQEPRIYAELLGDFVTSR